MTALAQPFFSKLRRNRDVLFFALNALGWLSWTSAQGIALALDSDPAPNQMRGIFITATTGLLLTTVLRYVCRFLWRQKPLVLVLGGLAAAYVTALPLRATLTFFTMGSASWSASWSGGAFGGIYIILMGSLYHAYLMVGWMGLYFGFHFHEANQKERETALRAIALAQAAQLKMLRYQLNPHFLFNTLNAISTLVLDQKNAVANTVVTRLADFLRYTLDQDPMKTVTLTQEITALNLYLEIEKMRFGARLKVVIDVEDSAGSAAVPSLLMQPLIENAIKYAIAPSEQGGSITIRGRLAGKDVVLSIEDDGPGMTDTTRVDSGRGVGLRNTRERLLAMYGDRAHLDFANTQPGLRISLKFPAQLTAVANA